MQRRLITAYFVAVLSIAANLVADEPTLPSILIDTTYSLPTGTTHVVNAGGNFQTALNDAALNDVIVLEAGATFTGNFTLPNKASGSGWIYIVSSAYTSLPRPGTRVSPSDATNMAKLTASSGAIITSDSSAHHYRFVGIEIEAGAYLNALVELSGGQGNLATQTNNIVIDRCYIHGHATNGSRRGVAAQGAYISVIDSYLSDFKEVGADTQAFAAWNGSGPFKLVNNYLEASTENVLFGGADSAADDFIPSDIEIRRNHLSKPLTWKADDPSYGGVDYDIKNLLELKSSKRVLIEGNLFEHNWGDAQNGFAILFTVRNQSGTAPWSTVEDVTFRGNRIKSVGAGFSILTEDTDGQSSDNVKRILIEGNLLTDITTDEWNGERRVYQFLRGQLAGENMILRSNTWPTLQDGLGAHIYLDGVIGTGFEAKYNIGTLTTYGLFCSTFGSGDAALANCTTDGVFTGNVLVGESSGSYTEHPGNHFPATLNDVDFENLGAEDYRLDSSSDYYGVGPGGADLGAWIPSAIAAESQLDWSISYIGSGTSVNVTFGYPALGAGTSCTVRAGTNTVASSSGAVERTVQVTGLTPDQQYAIMVDCGAEGGAISYDLYTATEASTGTATVGGAGSNTLAIGGGGSLTLTVSP